MDDEAAIHELADDADIAAHRQLDPTFEAAERQLEAMDARPGQFCRQRAVSRNNQRSVLDNSLDPLRIDAGKGEHDDDFTTGFKNIRRRFPTWQTMPLAKHEELMAQAL